MSLLVFCNKYCHILQPGRTVLCHHRIVASSTQYCYHFMPIKLPPTQITARCRDFLEQLMVNKYYVMDEAQKYFIMCPPLNHT